MISVSIELPLYLLRYIEHAQNSEPDTLKVHYNILRAAGDLPRREYTLNQKIYKKLPKETYTFQITESEEVPGLWLTPKMNCTVIEVLDRMFRRDLYNHCYTWRPTENTMIGSLYQRLEDLDISIEHVNIETLLKYLQRKRKKQMLVNNS